MGEDPTFIVQAKKNSKWKTVGRFFGDEDGEKAVQVMRNFSRPGTEGNESRVLKVKHSEGSGRLIYHLHASSGTPENSGGSEAIRPDREAERLEGGENHTLSLHKTDNRKGAKEGFASNVNPEQPTVRQTQRVAARGAPMRFRKAVGLPPTPPDIDYDETLPAPPSPDKFRFSREHQDSHDEAGSAGVLRSLMRQRARLQRSWFNKSLGRPVAAFGVLALVGTLAWKAIGPDQVLSECEAMVVQHIPAHEYEFTVINEELNPLRGADPEKYLLESIGKKDYNMVAEILMGSEITAYAMVNKEVRGGVDLREEPWKSIAVKWVKRNRLWDKRIYARYIAYDKFGDFMTRQRVVCTVHRDGTVSAGTMD